MRVVIGADHAGFELKGKLAAYLHELGHYVHDVGTHSPTAADYPDYAEAVGVVVRAGRADRGIVICGSGVGTSIAINKLPGIRAGLCHDTYSAHQGVEHDDMNVLVISFAVFCLGWVIDFYECHGNLDSSKIVDCTIKRSCWRTLSWLLSSSHHLGFLSWAYFKDSLRLPRGKPSCCWPVVGP